MTACFMTANSLIQLKKWRAEVQNIYQELKDLNKKTKAKMEKNVKTRTEKMKAGLQS